MMKLAGPALKNLKGREFFFKNNRSKNSVSKKLLKIVAQLMNALHSVIQLASKILSEGGLLFQEDNLER
jgi:hypothetical protein